MSTEKTLQPKQNQISQGLALLFQARNGSQDRSTEIKAKANNLVDMIRGGTYSKLGTNMIRGVAGVQKGQKLIGRMMINIVRGEIERDSEIFGRMDPYVMMRIGERQIQTRQCN